MYFMYMIICISLRVWKYPSLKFHRNKIITFEFYKKNNGWKYQTGTMTPYSNNCGYSRVA